MLVTSNPTVDYIVLTVAVISFKFVNNVLCVLRLFISRPNTTTLSAVCGHSFIPGF